MIFGFGGELVEDGLGFGAAARAKRLLPRCAIARALAWEGFEEGEKNSQKRE